MFGLKADAEDQIAQLQARIQEIMTFTNEELQHVREEKDSIAQEMEIAVANVAMIRATIQTAESEVEQFQQEAKDKKETFDQWGAMFTESNELQGNVFSDCLSARCGECQ